MGRTVALSLVCILAPALLTWEPWEGSHALPRSCAAGEAGGLPTRPAGDEGAREARGAGGVAGRPEAPAGGAGGLPSRTAGNDPLLRFFPTTADVPGLQAMGDARHCGGGEELTAIYDGGYQRYVQAGVTSASQGFFRIPGGTVEVTLHGMKNPETANTFLASLCKDIKAPVESRGFKQAKGGLCVGAGQESAYGYLALGKLVAMASLDRGDVKAARAILGAVAERAAGAGSSMLKGERRPVPVR